MSDDLTLVSVAVAAHEGRHRRRLGGPSMRSSQYGGARRLKATWRRSNRCANASPSLCNICLGLPQHCRVTRPQSLRPNRSLKALPRCWAATLLFNRGVINQSGQAGSRFFADTIGQKKILRAQLGKII